jgi:hypothetical protein
VVTTPEKMMTTLEKMKTMTLGIMKVPTLIQALRMEMEMGVKKVQAEDLVKMGDVEGKADDLVKMQDPAEVDVKVDDLVKMQDLVEVDPKVDDLVEVVVKVDLVKRVNADKD